MSLRTLPLLSCLFAITMGTAAQAYTFPATADWQPILQGGLVLGDVLTDGNNDGREVVGSQAFPAISIATDGTTFFYRAEHVRVRQTTSPPVERTVLASACRGVQSDTNLDDPFDYGPLGAQTDYLDTVMWCAVPLPEGARVTGYACVADDGLDIRWAASAWNRLGYRPNTVTSRDGTYQSANTYISAEDSHMFRVSGFGLERTFTACKVRYTTRSRAR